MQQQLVVVSCHYNPMSFNTRRTLTAAFEQQMQQAGAQFVLVECALGEMPFEVTSADNPGHLQVRCSSVIWNKENLINLGIRRALDLYPNISNIGWFDADIVFRNPHWLPETVRALQRYKVIQPWSDVYDLGPNGVHMNHFKSFCHQFYHRKPYCGTQRGHYEYWHSGYAWAARRDTLERLGGLFELAVLGAGDHHMAMAMVGKAKDSIHGGAPESYAKHVLAWQDLATAHVGTQIGYVPGTIEHSWHGRKIDRKYWDRWDIINRHQVDPTVDAKKNLQGVLEIAGNKPEFRHDVDAYFRARNEDANTIS